ncbi:MAG: OadG family protein [Clostridiaceae bacterium]|nr:OadG family protein [Clostridiaceae bacterium]
MLRLFASASADRPGDPSAILLAIIGFASVFIVLMLFALIISIMQKTANNKNVPQKTEKTKATISTPEKEQIGNNANPEIVSYAYGKCDLHDVDERTAALLMAIVADKTQFPLNELYFKSIRSLESEQNK